MFKSNNRKHNITKIKRCMALLLTGALFCTSCGCAGGNSGNSANTELASTTLLETKLKNPPKGYYETDVWQPVPMSGEELAEGLAGGEGCQWPLYITIDSQVGKLAFFGTDVGGIYRSTDGGVNWTPCTIGFRACGATGIAIDPNNINRVLALGVNSITSDMNGIYLSENAGESWDNTFPAKVGSYRDFRTQIVWDKSSYDKKIGGSKIAYWSRETKDNDKTGAEVHPALYKTEDGGKTWTEIPNSSDFAGCDLAVHPTTGILYASKSDGLYRSKNGGNNFEKILEGPVFALDVVITKPDFVFCTKDDGLYYSTDGGNSFKSVLGKGYPTRNPKRLKVSPVNINNMIVQNDRGGDQSAVYYTNDGGASWNRISRGNEEEYREIENCSIPYNARQNVFAWSPVDKDTVLTIGGDFIMRSTDGGKNFVWSNSGYTGIMTGGLFTFNVNHPEYVFNPSQDYNGFYSVDAGKTWKYIQWYMDWGGYTYGGYVVDENTVICGGDDRQTGLEIWTTFDGGKTINKTGHKVKGKAVAMGVPGNEDIIFMGEWRSTDRGKTWTQMENCEGVYTCDPTTGTLYGSSKSFLVKSTDNGVTWENVVNLANKISDIAWAADIKSAIAVAGGKVYRVGEDNKAIRYINVPSGSVTSVAVDDKNSDIIYVASRNGVVQTETAVCRTVDGGKTWVNLTRRKDDGLVGPDGAKEASCIRINSTTREILVGTCCRGVWKMPIPDVK